VCGVKILFVANTDWYLYNFRLPLARAARDAGLDVVFVSPGGRYAGRLRDEGFTWIELAMDRRSVNPFREIGVIRRLVQIYKHEKPNIVHHFTIKCVVYGSAAARIVGIRRRVNAITGLGHVFIDGGLFSILMRPVVRGLLRAALSGDQSRVILQNPDDQRLFLVNRLVEARAIRLIRGSGVNTGRFVPRSESREVVERVRVLLATRLLWEKGVAEFVEAAAIVLRSGVAAEFLVAGASDPGNPSSVPSEILASWVEAGLVTALGHMEEMPKLLGTVDIVVLPSYREGTPRILLEAAASGLPIVATDVPGCREIVEPGVNGLLVPPKNSHALAKAIDYLINAPVVRKQMGVQGRRKVLAEFDERLVVRETLDIYSELVSLCRGCT
jgi:glycosyltransferase involved in cell wall biosynthesis